MKKTFVLLMIFILTFVLVACSSPKDQALNEPIVNPINLTFSLEGDEALVGDDLSTVQEDAFIAEEGSTVLEATQLYCLSHDMSITVDADKKYISEMNGLTEGDYSDMTGWIFTVNGEMGNLGANEQVLAEGDKILWEFVDFSTYSW